MVDVSHKRDFSISAEAFEKKKERKKEKLSP